MLNSQLHDPSSGVSQKSERGLDTRLAIDPAFDDPQAADGLGLSSRDVETNTAPNAVRDVERRVDRPTPKNVYDQIAQNLKSMTADDDKCWKRATSPGQKLRFRSLGIEKRLDKPSDVLWKAGLAVVVDRGESLFHDLALSPPALGTKGLCGCTAVAIVSQVGCIVAHISPNVNTIDAQLAALLRLYNNRIKPQAYAYAYYFPPTYTNGEIKVPVFQKYITDFMLKSMQLGASLKPYVADPDGNDAHEGSVVVKKVAGAIALYLNEKIVN